MRNSRFAVIAGAVAFAGFASPGTTAEKQRRDHHEIAGRTSMARRKVAQARASGAAALLLLLAGCAATATPAQRWAHETFRACRTAAPTAVLVELRENGFVTARTDVTELARLEQCWLDHGGWSRHREPQRPPGPSGVEIQVRVGGA